MFELIHYRNARRVDHTSEGSKDVMDAWAGSVWNALIYSADEMPQANSETVPRFIHLGVEDDIFSVEELLGGVEL